MSGNLLRHTAGQSSKTLESQAPPLSSGNDLAGAEVKRAAQDSQESVIASDSNGDRIAEADAFRLPADEAQNGSQAAGEAGQAILLDHSIETAKLLVRRVTHDFNNLIAVVRGYAEVLDSRPQLDDGSKQMVTLIDRAAGEMAGLADRMAGFAEAEGFDRSPLNLNGLIENLLGQKGDFVPTHIELEVELSDLLPDVQGDKSRLQQACRNVWNNAIEAMPQGGKLTCQTSTQWIQPRLDGRQNGGNPSRFVRVRVTDTGEGMSAETLATMFAPFFTTKSGKCRGLGATAVYEIVRDLNGFIEVSSDPGSGTCIDLYFSALEDTSLPAPVQNDPPSREISRRLLVVDDDDMVRMATQRMLTHLGYESISASGGEEALAIYRQSAADIGAVILDVTMPGLSGLETLRLLREMDSQVKVIVYTGDPQAPGLSGLEPQAVSTVLPKPFRIEQLARAMERALE
jgi:signal transduction histidine kinase